MPADEVTHGTEVDKSRVRTGPRHAAPKKPLFTRFHMPAGKAIALAAMPTAVLMGMGFTPTLAQADSNNSTKPTSNSLTADEYKECVAALEDDASASPGADDSTDSDEAAEPTPSASASAGEDSSDSSGSTDDSGSTGSSGSAGDSSSSDSGSDEGAEPTPTPSASRTSEAQSGDTATPSPSASESGGNLLEEIGDAITGVFTGGSAAEESASPTPTPSASASEEAASGSSDTSDSSDTAGKDTSEASDPVKETAEKVTDTVKDTVDGATDKVSEAAQGATEAAGEATASPSPSASAGTDPEDCPAATDEEGGVDNTVPLPDDPWFLDASSLLLKGADYQGIVKVKTANGATKKVLKYVVSDGVDIGDLHQTVKDKQSGKTYHVQAAGGSTSTFRNGKVVMYTESISGNLLGLIPVTFDPEHPPPLNIPLIYFTKVKVVQAGQFGGTLHVPGLHSYITD
ncbi:hypothetical protein PBV52_33425 [Streptomyces sp. T12]|uniref:hypothetical protein n=1 Tax=Streptomyces sp. T12 TaxID=477697 RepID=UPI002366F771|nr:hypothetical protein [Streptomyces sp. T12]WDF41346.1 hypothetical protein PBV52_33425 [Streptomyces sp. T12]